MEHLVSYYIDVCGGLFCRVCNRTTINQKDVNDRKCRWCLTYHGYLDPMNQQDLYTEEGNAVLHRTSTTGAN